MTTRPENHEEDWPFRDPRVAGVREHYQRVQFFQALAQDIADPPGKFRLLLAAVNSARAVVELMFEAADKKQLSSTRKELETHLSTRIPWYDLIERIRIHDFHRFGVVPPDPKFKMMFQGGPVKLRAQSGAAVYRIPATGPEKFTTGNSAIEEQRPLLTNDGQFFDEISRQWVELHRIVAEFLARVDAVIKEFESEIDRTGKTG